MAEEAKWYVIHTYSGYENKVAASIQQAVENRKLRELISDVRVPMETVTEIKDNKKREVERKVYPGYVMVKMVMTDDTWYVVRNIRGVTGFVGPASKPIPLTEAEVLHMDTEMREIVLQFKVGDSIRVTTGYLTGFIGVVDGIIPERGILRATVSLMGKDVAVELALDQVESLG